LKLSCLCILKVTNNILQLALQAKREAGTGLGPCSLRVATGNRGKRFGQEKVNFGMAENITQSLTTLRFERYFQKIFQIEKRVL
jgi:hypothetical protein